MTKQFYLKVKGYWRKSMHVFHPMTSVLGTVWHPTRSYLQGTDKEQRVHEKQKTTYKNPKVKRSLTLLQHHRSKASILQCSAFFTVQLSHPYMTTRKTIGLTVWIFVGKVMPLLFNKLSSFVIAFLLRSCLLLISWLQWFWSPRKWSLSLFPLFPHLIAMKWWNRMPWS